MTELEAWKFFYNWAKTVPASVNLQFNEARAVIGRFIKRVEKANKNPAAAWRMIHEAMAEQGHVLVWSASAEDVRRFIRLNTGCEELPAGLSDKEIVKELKSFVRRYGRAKSFMNSMEYIERWVAYDLARRAGLKWNG